MTPTARIIELVEQIGGRDPYIGTVGDGIRYVRFVNYGGFRETRWGVSLEDLIKRLECHRAAHERY